MAEAECEELPRPPPPRPLSGLFYHTVSTNGPDYLAFDALRSAKPLISDPRFSAFPEPIAVLASTRGLVCVRGETTGSYYVSNPATGCASLATPASTRPSGTSRSSSPSRRPIWRWATAGEASTAPPSPPPVPSAIGTAA
ncbi:hypothetical protein E2562_000299 [Oryza meyeriana var. granulata]|uniref:Uncharacterized protein n=1 Tax=Oryza meyeriana var. granulata TaxID=110450 RepID=A0A6G1CLU4_9ORYZ|nr:hypothetical protein E2562_000299 [Oryza meyeriana var. granulata]